MKLIYLLKRFIKIYNGIKMSPFVCLLIATSLAISVGYLGTKVADNFRKDRELKDQLAVEK